MFVFNIHFKKAKLLTYAIVFVLLIVIILGIIKLVKHLASNTSSEDYINSVDVTQDNYTSILSDCYKNLDNYVGKTIKFSGFIYRLYDFKADQFVLGREMIVSTISEETAHVVVVGFLCESNQASNFSDRAWVEVEGTIQKGYFHSEIPVIQVTKITNSSCPENPYVYPPE